MLRTRLNQLTLWLGLLLSIFCAHAAAMPRQLTDVPQSDATARSDTKPEGKAHRSKVANKKNKKSSRKAGHELSTQDQSAGMASDRKTSKEEKNDDEPCGKAGTPGERCNDDNPR